MKSIYGFILSFICLFGVSACTPERGLIPDGNHQMLSLTLDAGGYAVTRSAETPADLAAQAAVNSVDVFFLDSATGAYVYSVRKTFTGTGNRSFSLEVPSGVLDVYALANAPEGLQVFGTSRGELLAAVSDYLDNVEGSLVMTGSVTGVDTGSEDSLTIRLERLVNKVRVGRIGKAANMTQAMVLKDVRLVNVPKRTGYFSDASSAPAQEDGTFLNPKGFSSLSASLYGNTSDIVVPVAGADVDMNLYFYGNPSPESAGVETEDYVTKAVFTVSLDGEDYFYPIGLPQAEGVSNRNKVYLISELVLNRKGNNASDFSPNAYLPEASVTATISVLDWDEYDAAVQIPENTGLLSKTVVFDVAGMDIDGVSGTLDVTVRSGVSSILGKADLGWTVSYSSDNGAHWSATLPSFLSLSKTASDGDFDGEHIIFTYDISGIEGIHFVRFLQDETGETYDVILIDNPFYLEAVEPGSFVVSHTKSGRGMTLWYSTDRKYWQEWDNTPVLLDNPGDRMYVYGTYQNSAYVGTFVLSGGLKAGGNVESLYGSMAGANSYILTGLFQNCTALLDAKDLTITNLDRVYNDMFSGCTNLKSAPSLKANRAAPINQHYQRMFLNCSSLEDVSGIEILSEDCYAEMFSGCSSLKKAPVIRNIVDLTNSNKTLARMFLNCTALSDVSDIDFSTICSTGNSGLASCFFGCKSLKKVLPMHITAMGTSAISNMYYGCTQLEDAADIVIDVDDYPSACCQSMFYGCSSLVNTPVMAPKTVGSNALYNIFSGCTSLTDISRIDLSDVDIVKEVAFYGVFYDCSNLLVAPPMAPAQIDKNGCNRMFSGCRHLEDVSAVRLDIASVGEGALTYMFLQCESLLEAPYFRLQQTAKSCCNSMFKYCYLLSDVSKVELSATDLAESCYQEMFYSCQSLTSAPPMEPTTVGKSCCQSMFYGCTSLSDVSRVRLLATTLAERCYGGDTGVDGQGGGGMFQSCSSLYQAPVMAPEVLDKECCAYMFRACSSLRDLSMLSLPATTMAEKCYMKMFSDCQSLTDVPSFTASVLAPGCCSGMFHNCINIHDASGISLPATDLPDFCYGATDKIRSNVYVEHGMFQGCSTLQIIPTMDVQTVGKMSCFRMFEGCGALRDLSGISLTSSSLGESCYREMFKSCTGIRQSPDLPAGTLVTDCYKEMFSGCTKLERVKAMFTTTPGTGYTQNWMNGVKSTGTFIKNASAVWNVTGANGIPSGWTVETATE